MEFVKYLFKILMAYMEKNIAREGRPRTAKMMSKKIDLMITQDLLTLNRYSRPGTKLGQLFGIVIHWPGSTMRAKPMRNSFERMKITKEYRGAHLGIDRDGTIIQQIPFDERAYHCGAKKYKPGIQEKLGKYPNAHTIGIEACVVRNDGRMSLETKQALLNICVWLCSTYGLDETDLYIHSEVVISDTKKCHRYFYENPGSWAMFKNDVGRKLDET